MHIQFKMKAIEKLPPVTGSLYTFNGNQPPIPIETLPKHQGTSCQHKVLVNEKKIKCQEQCSLLCGKPECEEIPPEKRPCQNLPPPRDPNECRCCHRKFVADRRDFHESICCKKKKKRTVYDSALHRVRGTAMFKYFKRKAKVWKKPERCMKNWHITEENFLIDIREAKSEHAYNVRRKEILAGLPPPLPTLYPTYVQCPHCSKKFTQLAAEIHVRKCANEPHEPEPLTECLLEYY